MEANVNLTSERAKVEYLAGEVEPRELEKAVEGAGYGGMEQMRGMGMMIDPQSLAKENPFDEAFIDAMIPHHQSAIYMAQVASEKSKIPEIKELAQNIVSAQKQEIEQMRRWREQWYPEG